MAYKIILFFRHIILSSYIHITPNYYLLLQIITVSTLLTLPYNVWESGGIALK